MELEDLLQPMGPSWHEISVATAKKTRIKIFEKELSHVTAPEMESLERMVAPPQAVVKSRKHTRHLIDQAHQKFRHKVESRTKPLTEELDIVDLRTEQNKAIVLLRIEYFRLLDEIAEYEKVLPKLVWEIENMQRILSDPNENETSNSKTRIARLRRLSVSHSRLLANPNCTSTDPVQLTPYIKPEQVVHTKEEDLRRIRRNLEVPDLWVPPSRQVDTLLRLTSATSFGTDYTRYYHPPPADLLDMDFRKERRNRLQKASEQLITSGWWREGRFDLRPPEDEGKRPSLKEQVRLAKMLRAQFARTTKTAKAMVIEWEIRARQMGCEKISQVIVSRIDRKNLY